MSKYIMCLDDSIIIKADMRHQAATEIVKNITLYRVQHEDGRIGGYIENISNLSQYGKAWVADNACVYGNAKIFGDAVIHGQARVSGDAWIFDNAQLFDEVLVAGTVQVCDNAQILGKVSLDGDLRIKDNVKLSGNIIITGSDFVLRDNSEISVDKV